MWRAAVRHLKSKKQYRWHAVKGPMGAVIATLLDLDWDPTEWDEWVDSLGFAWRLTNQQDAVVNLKTCDPLLRELRKDLQRQLWRKSTMNGFLQNRDPWIAGPRKQWLQYIKQGKYEEATIIIRIVADGLWTSQRVAAAATSSTTLGHRPRSERSGGVDTRAATEAHQRNKQSPHCRLCNAPVQCHWHTAWGCPKINAAESMQNSADLITQAHACRGGGEH